MSQSGDTKIWYRFSDLCNASLLVLCIFEFYLYVGIFFCVPSNTMQIFYFVFMKSLVLPTFPAVHYAEV